jgi:hypothetical protein
MMDILQDQFVKRTLVRLEKCFIIDLDRFSLQYDDKVLDNIRAFAITQLSRVAGLVSGVSQSTEYLVESSIALMRKFGLQGVYIFRLNPRQISYGDRKLVNVYRYGFGSFDVQYFGNDLISATIDGRTGLLTPHYELIKKGVTDIRLSLGYLKLIELETFFRDSPPKLLFGFLERFYYGFMLEFSYSMSAENPYNIDYKIVMNLHPNRYWYGDVLRGFNDFNTEILDKVQLMSEQPINFYMP